MKSKFTSIIMFFIIIAIIAAIGLLGAVLLNDIANLNIFGKQEQETAVYEENNFFDDNEQQNTEISATNNTERTIEKLEIPKSAITSSSSTISQNSSQNVNYDNISVDKYFYNQLNTYSQTIYKAFESNKENMKSGTHQINLGSTFSGVLSSANGQETLGDYYQSAIEAYMYDNPDVFYLNPSEMFLNIETTTKGNSKTYNVYINNGDSANYLIDEFNSKAQVDSALAQIESVKNQILSRKTGNTYQDIKMVHDYLVDNIEYDSSVSAENIYNIYGALVNHRCVCEGYAKAMKYLLDNMGIENTLVIGKAINSQGRSENHAWNYVKLSGVYYAVDSTWDDPIVIGGSATQSMRYKYFLKGQNEMNSDHFPSGKFTEAGMEFRYPPLSVNAY